MWPIVKVISDFYFMWLLTCPCPWHLPVQFVLEKRFGNLYLHDSQFVRSQIIVWESLWGSDIHIHAFEIFRI